MVNGFTTTAVFLRIIALSFSKPSVLGTDGFAVLTKRLFAYHCIEELNY